MRARLRRSRDRQMRKSPEPVLRQTCHFKTPHSHHVRQLISLQELDPLSTRHSIAVLKPSEMITINNTQYVHFLEQADALRRAGLLCDAIISVRNQVFRAHRLVLACVSRRLAKQLAREESDGPVRCSLESVSPRTFKQVLDFAYTRELEVTRDDLQLLLKAAVVLEMQPLEEQCRTQLERIHDRSGQVGEDGGKHRKQKLKRGPVEGEKPGETVGEVCDSAVIGDTSPSEPKTPDSPQPSVKKARLPSSSAVPCDRVSVISRHVGSSPSYSSSWTFPSTWKSASALRRLVDYSGFVPFHPLQQADPSAMPYHFSSSTHLPLLSSRFQSSAVAFSDLNYTRGLYAGSTGTRSRVKQGQVKSKKSQEGTFQTSEQSYNNEPESSTDLADENHQLSKCLYNEPGLRNTNTPSSTSGEPCGGCPFTGTGDVSRQQSRQQEHNAGKPHQCQHCPKKFSLKHQLDTHHRVHTGEKPFECRLCGQRSRDYSAMIKHLRTHNGASPYRCTVCLEFCSSLVSMQKHIKSHAVQDFPPGWNISNTYLYNSHT